MDGWYIESREQYAFVHEHPVPRPYGVLNQLATDFTSISGPVWIVLIAMLTFFITQGQWFMVVLPLSIIAYLGRSFLGLRRLLRYGETCRAVSTTSVSFGLKVTLPEEGVETVVGGLGVSSEALIEAWGAVELQLLVDRRRAGKTASATVLAFRPATGQPLDVEGLRAPLPRARIERQRPEGQ
jgi:hypothetical protein